jgi:signal transduction histidine kinase
VTPVPPPRRRRIRLPRPIRRILPRTFQGRLTVAFVGVIALTLSLVAILVLNRLDDYFTSQQLADLHTRNEIVSTYVRVVAESAADTAGVPVVGRDGLLAPAVVEAFNDPVQRVIIADRLGQADVTLQFGFDLTENGGSLFVPSSNGRFQYELQAPPEPGQRQEPISASQTYPSGPLTGRYTVGVTLENPFTLRATAIANVTGLLFAITLFALGLAVVVSAALARRFTTPLRQLTEASRDLAEGDLSRRVPAGQLRAGSSELGELAVQFNTMADRLEESVEISRRDRDRSREFLADVSHELRTPLAALRTFNQLLMEHAGDDPEARAEFLESSAGQIERLDWLAQNLLELSKLDSGLVLLDLRPDDLRAAVESATHQNDAVAARRGIALTVDLPPVPIRIRHDPPRIGQVVSNLVANAIKFTPRGGTVQVDVAPTTSGARIDVVDTGIGIDRAELPHIFERFYRGSRSNEARSSGSGLGLAIVRSIVEMHGGSITVESAAGSGSRFTVLLPADPRTVAGTPAAAQAAVATAAEGEQRRAEAADAEPGTPPEDGPPNMTETSPSDASQMNPASAP